jgi:hypothetical protein
VKRLALVLALLAAAGPAAAQAPTPAPSDSIFKLLRALSDSTDADFGAATVEFDTTGLDTLVASALTRPATPPPARHVRSLYPVLNYNRTAGAIAGAGVRVGSQPTGFLDLQGSYATSPKLGRYAFAYRRTLRAPAGPIPAFQASAPGRIGRRERLDLELRYAREMLPMMPEHADPDAGGIGTLMSGTNSQSVFERRGFQGALALWTGDWLFRAGVTSAQDKALPVATRYSFFGEEADVPENTPADADDFTEPFAEVGFLRRDWDFAGTVSARGTGDRRRLRGAAGKSWRLGSSLKLNTEFEAGATAAAAPRQRRFEIGGAKAVPSLPYGQGGTDHLLLTHFELTGAVNVLETLGLPHPEWLVLHPSVFMDYGSVWDDPAGRDVVFSMPPGENWAGAAGGGFSWRLGIPEPDVTMRMWMAWPVGPRGGDPQFNFTVGRTFELVGRL